MECIKMKKQSTFGNADLAKKMASQFGSSEETIKVKMRYVQEVQKFVKKVDEAHIKAEKSNLKFG